MVADIIMVGTTAVDTITIMDVDIEMDTIIIKDIDIIMGVVTEHSLVSMVIIRTKIIIPIEINIIKNKQIQEIKKPIHETEIINKTEAIQEIEPITEIHQEREILIVPDHTM